MNSKALLWAFVVPFLLGLWVACSKADHCECPTDRCRDMIARNIGRAVESEGYTGGDFDGDGIVTAKDYAFCVLPVK